MMPLVFGPALRLDKWLWYARCTQSRSEAQNLCESRRLRMDGRVIERASARVRPGAVLSYTRGGEVHIVRVEALAERRGPYVEARQLYTDLTPGCGGLTPATVAV
jgi:ribosome-associated heat shock protein Hsp15